MGHAPFARAEKLGSLPQSPLARPSPSAPPGRLYFAPLPHEKLRTWSRGSIVPPSHRPCQYVPGTCLASSSTAAGKLESTHRCHHQSTEYSYGGAALGQSSVAHRPSPIPCPPPFSARSSAAISSAFPVVAIPLLAAGKIKQRHLTIGRLETPAGQVCDLSGRKPDA